MENKIMDYGLAFLEEKGEVFYICDETTSGCIGVGVCENNCKYFYKIAGVKTKNACVEPEVAIKILKKSCVIYNELRHPYLTNILEYYDYNDLFVCKYEWIEGENLFQYWTSNASVNMKLNKLEISDKLDIAECLFQFMIHVHSKDYIATDFYDGSLMYDFDNKKLKIIDIDLFRKHKSINNFGKGFFGVSRLKAKEETILNEVLDARTNVCTLGAIIYDLFSDRDDENLFLREEKGYFIISDFKSFKLSKEAYDVLARATNENRDLRYKTVEEVFNAWIQAIK